MAADGLLLQVSEDGIFFQYNVVRGELYVGSLEEVGGMCESVRPEHWAELLALFLRAERAERALRRLGEIRAAWEADGDEGMTARELLDYVSQILASDG